MNGIACRASVVALAVVAAALAVAPMQARPITHDEGVLPAGTELNDDQIDRPNELFYSEENGGARSYLSILGDMLFATPGIFGGMARKAELSCATCHQQGHNNPKLFIPGLSARPGTFSTANTMFSPHSGGISKPVTPPSLRGAAHLAPYAHDGRFATLRDFVDHQPLGIDGHGLHGRATREQHLADGVVMRLFDRDRVAGIQQHVGDQ